MHTDELARLRKDFEVQAQKYPDLSLSVFIEPNDRTERLPTFRMPNHKVMLWQYFGDAAAREVDLRMNNFGFINAHYSAFAVVDGSETDLFRRMASRAGSLVPDTVRHSLATNIMANLVGSDSPLKPAIAINSDPVSTWLNLVLVSLAVFQPERLARTKLPVDPFAASLAAFDYIFNRVRQSVPSGSDSNSSLLTRQFDVALSFSGERRPFVSQVAAGLRGRSLEVFYDQFFEAELARPDTDILLRRIYHDGSRLVVVFISCDYERKEWCGLEWRAVRDLIKRKQSQSVMFFRFDDAEIAGLFSIDGYIDLRGRSPEDAVEAIMQRIAAQTA